MSLIPLTHIETGEEKQFADFASIASFLKSEGESAVKWTGWEFARLRAEFAEVIAMIEGEPTEAPAAEPSNPAVEPAAAQAPAEPAPAAPEAQEPTEPAAESLLERIEHAVEDIIHGDAPAADPS